LAGCPPKPEPENESIPKWKRKPVQILVKLPQFGANVKTWEYQIRWRMITNGGQDGDLIRPVIGAKGIPFFPGSSMKGAFRNACPEEKRLRYCGGEVVDANGNKRTKPGILRFHGGYPVGMDWAQVHRLVDIAHGQQPYQVMRSTKDKGENANVQISLYQPKFKFGISCPKICLDSPEWDEIKDIWEKALGYGIGSRVSAGYGYVKDVKPVSDRVLMSVHLNGRGVMSQLLLQDPASKDHFKTPEFRTNMFKAALRGHTLRLLGGLTNETLAKSLTQIIWGGIPEKGEGGNAIFGRIGIDFSVGCNLNDKGKHKYTNDKGKPVEMPTYTLENGCLSLISHSEVNPELDTFLRSLLGFSILLGGFGKSWRRIDHKKFYSSYFKNNDKPMIGCHWELTAESQDFLIIPNPNLDGITSFIKKIREQAIAWIQTEISNYQPEYVQNWRETWHSDKVQVWGRIAQNGQSKAVRWFHDTQYLKGSDLAGKMGKIGRVWHRMYPTQDGFIELLTIFPDESVETRKFLMFLASNASDFRLLWGGEQS
jgi:CRISPR-associated protein Cmr6